MLSEYHKGVRTSCVFYACMTMAVAVTHLLTGWENFSLTPKSGLVVIMSILVALVWTCVNVINLFSPAHRARNSGEAIVHGIMLSLAAAVIMYHQV